MLLPDGWLVNIAQGAGEVIGAIFICCGVAYFGWLRDRIDSRKKHPPFDAIKALNKNMRVRETLSEIRSLVGSDRVLLYQFHNGEYFVSGDSIQKLSLTHYASRRGVGHPDPMHSRHQNIPVTFLANTLKEIEQKAWQTNIREMPDHYFDKDLHIASGVESMVVAPVRNSRHVFFGILYVTWLHEVEQLGEEQLKDLHDKIQELAVDLTYKD